MPELPEVETTLRGIAPHINGNTIAHVTIRQPKLRWLIPANLAEILSGETVQQCTRRAKYLLIQFRTGILLIHLGMSGSLRIYTANDTHTHNPSKHDHVDFAFSDGTIMRYHDPRRFGAILWFAGAAEHHPLLEKLGPEPLSEHFTAQYLHQAISKQKRAIKLALMDNAIVVGIGNIYANESLFKAQILPSRPANQLTLQECTTLVPIIRTTLQRAIDTGGSTLRDFVNSDGKSGYFQQEYTVYSRHNEPCILCDGPIHKITLGQRSTFFCPHCQK